MQSNVVNLSGSVLRTIDLDDRVFGITPNEAVVHQAVVTQQANARQGTHDTRTRGEVAGGGKKPYRQKGTGYARQGSKTAPHYRGGGVVFGPHPRLYTQKVNRKAHAKAVRIALSAHAGAGTLAAFDAAGFESPSTKGALELLSGWDGQRPLVVVVSAGEESAGLSFRNLARTHVVEVAAIEVADLVWARSLLVSRAALEQLGGGAA
jgi:large subunit ribosomal protein L4